MITHEDYNKVMDALDKQIMNTKALLRGFSINRSELILSFELDIVDYYKFDRIEWLEYVMQYVENSPYGYLYRKALNDERAIHRKEVIKKLLSEV